MDCEVPRREGRGCYSNVYERTGLCGVGGEGRESLPKRLKRNLTGCCMGLATASMWESEVRDEALLSLSLYLEGNGWPLKDF